MPFSSESLSAKIKSKSKSFSLTSLKAAIVCMSSNTFGGKLAVNWNAKTFCLCLSNCNCKNKVSLNDCLV